MEAGFTPVFCIIEQFVVYMLRKIMKLFACSRYLGKDWEESGIHSTSALKESPSR